MFNFRAPYVFVFRVLLLRHDLATSACIDDALASPASASLPVHDSLRKPLKYKYARCSSRWLCFMILVLNSLILGEHAQGQVVLEETFATTDHWTLDLRQGALGTMRVEQGRGLIVDKTGPLGTLVLHTSKPLQVKAGVTYRFEAYYHCDDAPIGNLFLLRATPSLENIQYDAIDRTAGWVGNSLIVNAPRDAWQLRRITYKPSADGEIWPAMVFYGNPMVVKIRDVKFFSERETLTPNRGPDMLPPMPRDTLLEKLAEMPESKGQLKMIQGKPVLTVNGQPIAPSFYRTSPYSNLHGDYKAFMADGVTLLAVPMKIGQNHQPAGIWEGPGKYNFQVLEDQLAHALGLAPDAKIIIDLSIYPYHGWGDARREECWTNAEGQIGYGQWGNVTGFTDDLAKVDTAATRHWYYPSYQSQAWRQESQQAIRDIVAHLRTTPYWNSVVGVMLMGGHDGTFQIGFQFDYSKATLEGFIDWTRRQYTTVDAVNAAWGSSHASFDEITIPLQGSRDSDVEATAPLIQTDAISDYRQYLAESAWSLRDVYARAFKEAAQKPVFTIAYAGGGGLRTAAPSLHTQYLDAIGTMSYYPWRTPGIAPAFDVPGSLLRHGKFYFQELDMRSWVGSLYLGVYNDFISAGMTPETWDAIHRKLVGVSLANDTGWWYYDMGRYFNDPAIHQQLAPVQALAERLAKEDRSSHLPREVAVVYPNTGMQHVGAYYSSLTFGGDYQQMQLESSGVAFDQLFLDDLLNDMESARQYRLIIFIACGNISQANRQKIRQLQSDHRWLLWMHESGYLGGQGERSKAMSDLIGIQIQTRERYARMTTLIAPDAPEKLVHGVEPLQGMSEAMLTIMALQGRSSFVARYQPFWVEDAQATALMRYQPSNQVAAAKRDYDHWTAVYLGAPNSLSNTLLHNLAQAAGAFVMGQPGQSLDTNGRFASIHGLSNKQYTLQLPHGKSRVLEALTGKVLSEHASQYTFDVQAGQTYWMLFE